MSILVDTNLLLRSIQPNHPQFQAATDTVLALRQKQRLCITTQNLYELWAVCTRPAGENGIGMTSKDANAELAKVRRFFIHLPDRDDMYDEWERLVILHDVKGRNTYDARLVAAMKVHGIEKILTFNKQDFSRFPNIEVLTPVAASQPS
jgi:predicted nucleic acid-binding protein